MCVGSRTCPRFLPSCCRERAVCARGARTCPRFRAAARAPPPASRRESRPVTRKRRKCARTSPGSAAFRAHLPRFPGVSGPRTRALPPASCQRGENVARACHKCAGRWQKGGICARAARTCPRFRPAAWPKGGTCARARPQALARARAGNLSSQSPRLTRSPQRQCNPSGPLPKMDTMGWTPTRPRPQQACRASRREAP
jgi:hypothetical protein